VRRDWWRMLARVWCVWCVWFVPCTASYVVLSFMLGPQRGWHTQAATWGRAYLLPHEQQAEIIQYLEEREKQYDLRLQLQLYTEGEAAKRALVGLDAALCYVASPASPNYLGPAESESLAAQIAAARGPSGENSEYVYRLASCMRELGVEDAELFELERRVRTLREEGVAVMD
jgi:cation transport regulator ChaC